MASTNKTSNYSFPQWVSSDKPSWIKDLNPAFSTIDTALKSAADAATNAASAAVAAQQAAQQAAAAASTAQSAADNAVNLLVDLGVTNASTAAAFKAKVDNSVQKYDILASYFDAQA